MVVALRGIQLCCSGWDIKGSTAEIGISTNSYLLWFSTEMQKQDLLSKWYAVA